MVSWYDLVAIDVNYLYTYVYIYIYALAQVHPEQVLRRSNAKFNFCNGSVGNFFFAGTRLFFHSLDAAIFLYSRVSGTPPESLVLPCIETNERLSIGAELQVEYYQPLTCSTSHLSFEKQGGKMTMAMAMALQFVKTMGCIVRNINYFFKKSNRSGSAGWQYHPWPKPDFPSQPSQQSFEYSCG